VKSINEIIEELRAKGELDEANDNERLRVAA